MTTESQTQAAILKYLGNRKDVRCWRNNTGRIADKTGRVVSFGLVGSADIIGIRVCRCNSEPTVSPFGQFLAVEVKSDTGRQSEAQKNFQAMVEAFGGLYVLARRVEDLYPWFPPTT